LQAGWSPASIAGRLPRDYPGDQACRVSHEAIYQWVVASDINDRPRKIHDWKKPSEIFAELVEANASTD
jgi:IS30 family transposase